MDLYKASTDNLFRVYKNISPYSFDDIRQNFDFIFKKIAVYPLRNNEPNILKEINSGVLPKIQMVIDKINMNTPDNFIFKIGGIIDHAVNMEYEFIRVQIFNEKYSFRRIIDIYFKNDVLLFVNEVNNYGVYNVNRLSSLSNLGNKLSVNLFDEKEKVNNLIHDHDVNLRYFYDKPNSFKPPRIERLNVITKKDEINIRNDKLNLF